MLRTFQMTLVLKSKSSRFPKIWEETKPLEIYRCKSKKGASVSEVLVYSTAVQVDILVGHFLKIRIVNIEKIVYNLSIEMLTSGKAFCFRT